MLKFEDFAGKVGKGYDILAGGSKLTVTLEQAQPLPGGARESGAFRLLFRGPFDPWLPQGTYMFRLDTDTGEIFIVPIARDQAGTQYEAVFF